MLGLLAYLAWPTWKGATAQHEFAALLEAHRDYAMQLLRELAHPGRIGASRLRGLELAARRARSAAQAAAEPVAGLLAGMVALLIGGLMAFSGAYFALERA